MKRNFDNRLWLFGDSFMQYNTNWVHELALRCKARVNHLGFGGSSVQFLLMDLIRYKNLIRPNDKVLIGITNPARFYLKDRHYHYSIFSEYYTPELYKQQQVDAFKDYMVQLHDDQTDNLYKGSIVSHILKVMVPNLSTDNIQHVYTVSDEEYVKEPVLYLNKLPVEPLLAMFRQFLQTYNVKGYDKEKDNFLEILDTRNHWIDHPEFKNYFWNYYNEHFSILYDN